VAFREVDTNTSGVSGRLPSTDSLERLSYFGAPRLRLYP
jgi:hypothetical protein